MAPDRNPAIMQQAFAPFPDLRLSPPEPAQAAAATHGQLETALLESRQRWRELVGLVADFVFETDEMGRLSFVSPDIVLGWPSSALLGKSPDRLLADAGGPNASNPFHPTAPIRRRRAWLTRADGGATCLMFAAAPLLDAQGRVVGSRGIGQDVTEQDGYDDAIAVALRRGELIDHILWRMRQEVMAPRMMEAVLDSLCSALGAEGAAVIDMLPDGVAPSLTHQYGCGSESILPTSLAALGQTSTEPIIITPVSTEPTRRTAPDGRLVLVCPSLGQLGVQMGLALWRPPGGRAWDTDDTALASSVTGIARVIVDHDNIQREMARQARTDPLTGLLNRRAFLDEIFRRIERLDRDGLPGTLLFIDLDHFKTLNDTSGHKAGDDALCLVADLLRAACRAADLVARLGGDEFALWLDGTDELAAAERAETLRLTTPEMLASIGQGGFGQDSAVALTMSIGIATRWPGRADTIEALVSRADQAMYQVKRAGRGHWRVGHMEP